MEVQVRPDLRALLAAESAWLHALARGLLADHAAAADVAQDAALLALRKRPPVAGRRQVRAWLAEVVRRLARAARRDSAVRAQRETRTGADAGGCPADGDETARRLELHRLVLDAVMDLPEPYRSAVVQRYFDGLPPREIARRAGASDTAARQQIARGLKQLRARLARDLGGDRRWRRALAPFAGALTQGGLWSAGLVFGATMTTKKIALAATALVLAAVAVGVFWQAPQANPSGNASGPAPMIVDATGARPPATVPTERRAPAVAAHTAWTLEVVDARGGAVAGGRAWFWVDAKRFVERRLGRDGTARFPLPASDPLVSYLVIAEGYAPSWRTDLPPTDRRHRVVLGRGPPLAGRVLVDGESTAGVVLRLRYESADLPALPTGLAKLLQRARLGPATLTVTSGAGGQFTFRGVPADFRGALVWPYGYAMRDNPGQLTQRSERSVLLQRVRTDVVLDLLQYRALSGIARWADTGDPIPHAELMATFDLANGAHAPMTSAAADAAGRFRIPIENRDKPAVRRVRLFVRVGSPALRHAVEFGEEEFGADLAVVVRVPRPARATFHFVVQDADGRPVQGARLAAAGRRTAPSAPTDAAGRGRIEHVSGQTRTFVLGATGFRFRRVELPAVPTTADNPWQLAMTPGNKVRFEVTSPGTVLPAGLEFVVRYASRLFDGAEGSLPTRLHETLAGLSSGNVVGGTVKGVHYRAYRLPADGVVEFSSLAAQPFTVEVHGRLESVAVHRDVPAVGAAETRRVPLVIRRTPRTFRVHVTDPGGRPLRAANVVFNGARRGHGTITDAAGRCALGPLFLDPAEISLEVRRTGHAPLVLPRLEHDEVEVVLQPSVLFQVVLRDPLGQPVDAIVDARPESGGESERGTARPAGVYEFKTLPRGTVELTCRIGGDAIRHRGDTAAGRIEVRVPAVGALEIRYVHPESREPFGYAELRPIKGATAARNPVRITLRRDGDVLVGVTRAVHVGRYRVYLGVRASDAQGEVTVRAGATSKIELPR